MKESDFPISPGSGIGFKAAPLVAWGQSQIFYPPTDRQHFLIIRTYVPEVGDYEFIESTCYGLFAKGVRHGYLFQEYGGSDVEIYEVDCPEELRRLAPLELVRWGKSKYDFGFILRVIISIPVALSKILFCERRLRRLRAEDLPYIWDDALVCTEAFWLAYNAVGVNVIPLGVPAIPPAYKTAEQAGRMRCYFKGILPQL